MRINGVDVTDHTGASKETILAYIDQAENDARAPIEKLTISEGADGKVRLDWEMYQPKFERIRRITGYLVGTTDRWNNAKRDEERERVKHGV